MEWILYLDIGTWDLNHVELNPKINVYFIVQLSLYMCMCVCK